jgi:Uma2 family endonuclease
METKTVVTAEELFAKPDEGKRYELVSGELRMMSPSGWRHGEVVGNVHTLVGYHVRKHQLGKVFGAETGFR